MEIVKAIKNLKKTTTSLIIFSCVVFAFILVVILSDTLRNRLLDFNPAPSFLSDIAGFEAMTIALVIPLSFEIVSRISERYKSEVISKHFIGEWELKILLPTVLINIILAIGLRFLVNDQTTSVAWKIAAWVTIVGFFLVAIVLLLFVNKLKRYMTNTEETLKSLCNEAKKLLKQ